MPTSRWTVRIVDDPDTEPCAQAGELMLAVRTPRSREFVTVEVGSARESRRTRRTKRAGHDVLRASAPLPWIPAQWRGEMRLGESVQFRVGHLEYALTLAKLEECATALPWIACEFVLEEQ